MKNTFYSLSLFGFLSACGGSGSGSDLVELDPQDILLPRVLGVSVTPIPGTETVEVEVDGDRTVLSRFPAHGADGFQAFVPGPLFQEMFTKEENGLTASLIANDLFTEQNVIAVSLGRTEASVLPDKGDAVLTGKVRGVRSDTTRSESYDIVTLSADATLSIDFVDATVSGRIENTVLLDRSDQRVIATGLEDVSLASTPLQDDGTFSSDNTFSTRVTYSGLLGGSDGRAAALAFSRTGTGFQDTGIAILSD